MNQTDLRDLLVQMQYPSMPVLESNITRAWIRAHGAAYDRLEFNVRLGKGQDIQPGVTGSTAVQFSQITRKRADIVCYAAGVVDLVEVKSRMNFSAIGQLTGYRHLWLEEFPNIPVRDLIAVAQLIDDDVRRVLDAQKLTYYQVEPEARA